MSRDKHCVLTRWHDGHALVCATGSHQCARQARTILHDRLLKVFGCDRESSVATEIVRPHVAIEILCRDWDWGGGGQGALQQSALDALQSE